MVQKSTLPGGLRILVEEMPHTRSASIGLHIGVGSRFEHARISGIAHFIEHLLFKGTERYPNSRALSEAVEGLGGFLNAYTSTESTVFYAKVADLHFERALDVLSEMVCTSRFDAVEIEKERRVIIEELHMTLDSPSELVHQLLDETLWGDQQLGRDIAGSEESVSQITRDDILEFFGRYYGQCNTVVSVAGNVRFATVVEQISRALEHFPAGERPVLPAALPPRPGPSLRLEMRETEQVNLCLGLPALAWSDPDRRALQVLDTVLGSGSTSRLFQNIREERGLAYAVESYRNEYNDTGKWAMYAAVDAEQLQPTLKALLEELRALRDAGITAAELARVKEQVKGGVLLSLEDSGSVSGRNGSSELRYGYVVPIEQIVAEIEAVTQADVLRVAQRLLQSNMLHMALVGPYKDATAFQPMLTLD